LNKKTPLVIQRGFVHVFFDLEWDYVDCLQTFGAFFNREFHFLTFSQIAEALGLNGGIMDEDILAIFTSEKTITLGGIEPFDRADDTFRHVLFLFASNKKYSFEMLIRSSGRSIKKTTLGG
jgi:hypothetical protein